MNTNEIRKVFLFRFHSYYIELLILIGAFVAKEL